MDTFIYDFVENRLTEKQTEIIFWVCLYLPIIGWALIGWYVWGEGKHREITESHQKMLWEMREKRREKGK